MILQPSLAIDHILYIPICFVRRVCRAPRSWGVWYQINLKPTLCKYVPSQFPVPFRLALRKVRLWGYVVAPRIVPEVMVW